MRCLLLLEVKKIGEEPCLVDPIWKDQHSFLATNHGSSQQTRISPDEKGSGAPSVCSMAQQGKQICFTPFLASKTGRNNTWILDSGATNHMTPNFQFFDTYEPFASSKQITICQWDHNSH